MYRYNATILRVIDGDTVHAEIDLGLDQRRRIKLRLYGINAPELHNAGGKESRSALAIMVDGKQVVLETIKDRTEKYGRYLATLFLPDATNVNQEMIRIGHAVAYMV